MPLEPVLVGLSGGVDSSAAIIILKRRGHPVFGVSLVLTPGKSNRCCNDESIRRAELLCSKLGVRFFTVDVSERFEREIIQPFVEDYRSGITPNPCMICNPNIKWRYLINIADKLGIPKVATGHYARIVEIDGSFRILRGVDRRKDQSYFLARLEPQVLARTILPLGELTKDDVKKVVAEFSDILIPRESQEVCFVNDGDLLGFFESRGIKIPEGPTYDQNGNLLGIHPPAVFTVGKRHQLGIAVGKRMYVVKVLPNFSGIVVDTNAYSRALIASDPFWFSCPSEFPARFLAQIRYRHIPASCTVDTFNNNLRVIFDKPQWAITPGQYVVFYSDDMVMGSARIVESFIPS